MPKKKNYAKYVLVIFMALIMITGFVGLGGVDDSSVVKYEGMKFVQLQNGLYLLHYNNNQFYFFNDPKELNNINLGVNYEDFKDASKIYLSVNPSSGSNIVSVFNQNLGFLLDSNIVVSCFDDFEGCEELPLKTCDGANMFNKVIILDPDDSETTNYKNGCLSIKSREFNKYTDKFVLELIKSG